MEDFVNLGESSQCPSTQVPIDLDCELDSDFVDNHAHASSDPTATTPAHNAAGTSRSARSSSGPSLSQSVAPHKVRGPNWTEAEMFVLIGQKRVEWDSRHNCNQPSLAKFVYGTTAWKLVLAGCMSVHYKEMVPDMTDS